eukprot:m51a1_g6881 hypothetical protein (114) ;mRNA; f:221546-222586
MARKRYSPRALRPNRMPIPCTPGGACYGFPGFKCSVCCTLFSLWGVIMLFALGSSLSYRGVTLYEVEDEDMDKDKKQMFIAGAIYAALVVGCGARWIYLQIMMKTNPKHPGLV